MKRALFLPAAVLGLLLAFSLWNSFAMSAHVRRWQSQVDEAVRLAEDGDWSGAAAALDAGYADWSRKQTYLHTVTQHDAVDDAGAMYHRAMPSPPVRKTANSRQRRPASGTSCACWRKWSGSA